MHHENPTFKRCQNGEACEDVRAPLRAVDRARDLDGVPRDHPALAQLRKNAARLAAAHNYGQKTGEVDHLQRPSE